MRRNSHDDAILAINQSIDFMQREAWQREEGFVQCAAERIYGQIAMARSLGAFSDYEAISCMNAVRAFSQDLNRSVKVLQSTPTVSNLYQLYGSAGF